MLRSPLSFTLVRIAVLKVLLVDDHPDRAAGVRGALAASGCEVVCALESSVELHEQVRVCAPDVIVINIDSPGRDTFQDLCAIGREQPRPVVIFTRDANSEKIREAVHAGASAYVVDGIVPERIKPIMDAAIARFEQYQALRRELEATEEKLAERKAIERAKGILMKSRKLSEDDAYRALRKMAMDRNLRLADVAEQVISVSKLLG